MVGYNSSVIVLVFCPVDFGAPITRVDISGRFVEVSLATGAG